jgi:hypothetical protein
LALATRFHARRDLGAALGRQSGEALLASLLALGTHLLAPRAHLLAGDAAVTVGVEPREALLGAGERPVAGDFGGRAPAALRGLGGDDAGACEQCSGDKADLDGFHG